MNNLSETKRDSSDTISRQAAIDALGEAGIINYNATGNCNGMIHAINVIKGLPPAEPEHKTGHWIEEDIHTNWSDWTLYFCCECGCMFRNLIPRNFCPNCGTKMEVKE